MARCPFAIWKPLPENKTEPLISPKGVVVHSAVSDAKSLFPYFARADVNVESHFYINEDGIIEQYLDTERQGDAQFAGNCDRVSIETWDGGDPNVNRWNVKQFESLVRLIAWLCDEHGWPIVLINKPTASGVGYHSLFPGVWTHDGRSCPGTIRILQLPAVIEKARSFGKTQVAPKPVAPKPAPPAVPAFPGTVKRGSRGNAVRKVQQRLRDRGWAITVDGVYGPDTEATVREFQRRFRVPGGADGISGINTWRYLWTK